jgi:3-methyladenine DNA glycosylase AlkD
VTSLADRIARALKPLGTKERAVKEKAYLKSDLVHWGISVPKLRPAVKAAAKGMTRTELLAAIDELWPRGIYELRAACSELLVLGVKLLEPGDLARIEQLLREARTWALVDQIATAVVGPLVVAHPALGKTLDRWAIDPDFWIRRSALLALLVPLRQGGGDFERFGRYADPQLEDKEFFIRKAIGWILREVSKKRPELVVEWLAPRASRASGLTLREATRQLTPKQQQRVTSLTRKPARGT